MRAEQVAQKVADRAAEAWYGHHVTSDDTIAVGVVAGLALMGKEATRPGRDLAADFLKLDDSVIADFLALQWAKFWLKRPDLGRHSYPLRAWTEDREDRPDIVRAAGLTAKAAVKAGLFNLTEHDRLHETDLIGAVYMAMRTDKGRQARGEYYTPPDVCDAMARMILGGQVKEGAKIGEPAAGTGGMIRAAAQVLREQHLDPADMWWFASDISPVSVAGLAVNLDLWDIGSRTVIGVADTLTDPAWQQREWEAARGAFEYRDELLAKAAIIAAVREVQMLTSLAAGEAEDEPARLPPQMPAKVPPGPVVQLTPLGNAKEVA